MKKQVITTKQGDFTIIATLSAQAVLFPFENKADKRSANYKHNRYNVTVKTESGRTSFKFYDSAANLHLTELNDLRGAFECFVSDAIAGGESFDEFCSNFGYDPDSRIAERQHRACVRSYESMNRIFTGDLYDLSNELQEAEQ